MSKINYRLLNRIPEYLQGIMEYYPDVFLFQLNQIQYNRLWNSLSSAQYIYTNGYEIRPTNWFMHAFQSIKGWLGLENHCHPAKVSYTLNKLAYYGYSRRLTQPDFSKVAHHQLTAEISSLAIKEYEESTTAQLQNELIKAYYKVEPQLNVAYAYQNLSANHRFGDSWFKVVDEIELVPMLDPQDKDLILELIKSIEQKGFQSTVPFLEQSKFARLSAQYYYDKAKNPLTLPFLSGSIWQDRRLGYLTQALIYDPQITLEDPPLFAEYYLAKKEYLQVINLMPLLKDAQFTLKLLLDIPQPIRDALIKKDSSLTALLAQHYYNKAKNTPTPSFLSGLMWQDPRPDYLTQALIYNPKIALDDPRLFAKYYLAKKEYQQAMKLVPLLTDAQLALKLLLDIPQPIRDALIEKDSPLAAQLAQYYLGKKHYSSAQQIYSNIEELSPTVAFTIAIKEKNHFKAYEIFKRCEQTTNFPKAEREALAKVFFNAAEVEYEKGVEFRQKKIWSDAERHYFHSLIQKKAAKNLNPSKENIENVFTHQRLYAQILVDADLDLNKPENSNLANIQKAITLLRECRSSDETENDYCTTTLANALMRRADTLREKIAFTFTPSDHSSITEHKVKHQKEIEALIKTLEELIILLTGTSEQNLLLFLGKAHYLLADTHCFFNINDPNINQNYRKAMETVPENPFYLLRASELFEHERDTLQELGVPKLKSMGFQVIDYYHWANERWVKRDHIIYDIKDIHTNSLNESAVSSSSFSF